MPPRTILSKSYFCNHLTTILTDELIPQALNTLHLLVLLSTTLSTSFPTLLMGEACSTAASQTSAPAAGRREVPVPREVPVNRHPEGKGEPHSRAGALPPSMGWHKTP